MTSHIGCENGLSCTECPHQAGGLSSDGFTTAAAAVRKYIEESHNYNDAVAQEAFPTVRLQFPHFTSRKVRLARLLHCWPTSLTRRRWFEAFQIITPACTQTEGLLHSGLTLGEPWPLLCKVRALPDFLVWLQHPGCCGGPARIPLPAPCHLTAALWVLGRLLLL